MRHLRLHFAFKPMNLNDLKKNGIYSIQINVFVKRIDTIQIVCFLHMIYSYKTCIKFNLFLYIPTPLLMMQLIFLLTLNQQLFCFRDLHRNMIACIKQPWTYSHLWKMMQKRHNKEWLYSSKSRYAYKRRKTPKT